MTFEDLQHYLKRTPFHPLMIYLTDGSRFEVRHSELVLVSAHRLELSIMEDEDRGIEELKVAIALGQICRIELEKPSKTTL